MNWSLRVSALALLALLAACARRAPPYEEVRPVRTVTVEPDAMTTSASYAGEVRARREAQLGFRVGGKIVARYIELGQHVRAGEAMFRLYGRDMALQAAAANSQLTKAKLDLARSKELKTKGFISQASVDQAQAGYDIAAAQYRLAADQDAYGVLKAEHDGVVTTLNGEVGQVVAAGQPVATVAEDGTREVAVSVPESRVDELRHAKSLDITLWAAPGKHYRGELRDLAVDTDPATRTYAARITIEQPDDAVRLGMTATVTLPTGGARGFELPLTAVYDTDGHPKVWVVNATTHRGSLHAVQLAGARDDSVLVAAGLKPGEVVVTAGAHLLHENELVRLAASQLARP